MGRADPEALISDESHILSEVVRLKTLRSLSLLDTPSDLRFDQITNLAAFVSGAPIALISLVDESRLWFKSKLGLKLSETARADAFCDHAISAKKPVYVADAQGDARYSAHPLVVDAPHVRFYAGWPLILENGAAIGTLCVLDTTPRLLSTEQKARLSDLAAMTVDIIGRQSLAHARSQALESLEEKTAALDGAREYYRSIFKHLTDPLVVQEPIFDDAGALKDFIIRACNDAACVLQGLPREKLVGQFVSEMLPNLPKKLMQSYAEVIQTGTPLTFEHHYEDQHYDDWFRVAASRTHNGSLLLQLTTITDQKNRESQLQRSRDALNSFASVISHDLRTPLGHIGGFVELLEEELGDALTDTQREYMGYITAGVSQMRRLIKALQKHARLGQIEVTPKVVNLDDLMGDLSQRYDYPLAKVGGTLRYDRLGKVFADDVLLDQMLSNLIGNSLRYRSEDRPLQITVSVDRTESETIIKVTDNGRGIPPDYHARVFNLFDRGPEAVDHKNAMGLGLTTCRAIAKAHGGDIELDGTTINGCTFIVSFPRRYA
ncbi:MAG: ATP-binding protein [Pseudomonadota bacterium]